MRVNPPVVTPSITDFMPRTFMDMLNSIIAVTGISVQKEKEQLCFICLALTRHECERLFVQRALVPQREAASRATLCATDTAPIQEITIQPPRCRDRGTDRCLQVFSVLRSKNSWPGDDDRDRQSHSVHCRDDHLTFALDFRWHANERYAQFNL